MGKQDKGEVESVEVTAEGGVSAMGSATERPGGLMEALWQILEAVRGLVAALGLGQPDPLKSAMLENRLTGQKTTFWCLNYIYSGDLTGAHREMVELTNPIVVYETGEFDDPKWKDFSKLPHKIYIMKENVESWGVLK